MKRFAILNAGHIKYFDKLGIAFAVATKFCKAKKNQIVAQNVRVLDYHAEPGKTEMWVWKFGKWEGIRVKSYCPNCGGSGTDYSTDSACQFCDGSGWNLYIHGL